MKYLSVALLATVGTIATSTAAMADEYRGAALLQTQPISVNQVGFGRTRITPYRAVELNNATATLQANPKKPAEDSIFPPNLVPASMVRPTSAPSVNPLEFFQIPALDGGVKVRVGGD